VLVAFTPGSKPRPVVVDAARAAELAKLFTDARIACLAGQEALDGLAELDALAAQQDLAAADAAVVDVTTYCGGEVFRGGPECELPDGHDGPHSAPSLTADAGELSAPAAPDDDGAGRLTFAADASPDCASCGRPAREHDAESGGIPGRCDAYWDGDAEDEPGTQAYADKYASRTVQRELLGYQGDDGPADDEPVITVPADPGWRDERTGLMSGPAYQHMNRLSCGCTFAGPLTWPAGRKAHCDTHGAVTTVSGEGTPASPSDGDPDEPMPVSFLPLRRAARIGGGA
jgi:hypothetical protein